MYASAFRLCRLKNFVALSTITVAVCPRNDKENKVVRMEGINHDEPPPKEEPLSTSSSNSNFSVLDRKALEVQNADALSRIGSGVEKDNDEDGQGAVTMQDKLAFWRACKGNVEAAQLRLKETLQWRRTTQISDLLLSDDAKWREQERKMRSVLWYDYLGLDQHGRPVMVERVGRWDIPQVLASLQPPEDVPPGGTAALRQQTKDDNNDKDDDASFFLTLHCLACEILGQMKRPSDCKDDRGQVIIMDCGGGLSYGHFNTSLIRAFGKVAKNDEKHYTDTLVHLFVVNAFYLFSALVKVISPFLDKDTATKIHVSSSVPVQDLVACVGSQCLPVELGGTRQNVFPYDETAPPSEYPILTTTTTTAGTPE